MTGRGIDHLVLCVHDLDRARDTYARMGFTLTPKAVHPFGTGNSLVQLEGCFLELLSIVEPEKITEPSPGAFGFAAFNRDFLGAGEGFSMLVFESGDAAADRREFADKGLSRLAPFDFERLARLPDGSDVTVGFSLTFVTHPDMPRAAFFTCQQHAPQYFWKPEYQRHANTARTVAEVVMVAEAPDRHVALFAGLHGADAVTAGADGIVVSTARGRISVLTPRAWAARYGALAHPDLGEGPRFAAFRIAVADLAACAARLDGRDFEATRRDDRLIVSPDQAFGVLIEFAPSGE
jgi:hypothetical protein